MKLSEMLSDLEAKPGRNDKFGQADNLNRHIYRITANCDNVTAELICYTCIEPFSPQRGGCMRVYYLWPLCVKAKKWQSGGTSIIK